MSGDIKAIEVEAKPGETKDGKKVLAITITETGAVYKLSDEHSLEYVDEDETQANFKCTYCGNSIGFVLPKLGDPACSGDEGARVPPANFMTWMDRCSV